MALRGRLDRDEEEWGDLEREVFERGTCLFPPATSEDIELADSRLGVALPGSYKSFLRASNGFAFLGLDVEDALVRPVGSVCWLRDGEPSLVESWGAAEDTEVSDDVYFRYGQNQDCVHIRSRYFRSLLQLSDYVESAALLLNPEVTFPDGEWEGWIFGTALPGAHRYRSFSELMLSGRDLALNNLRTTLAFAEMMKSRPPRPQCT